MDRKKLTEEAERFQGESDCYVHVEMKDGGQAAVLLAGGAPAVLYGLTCCVAQMSRILGQSTDITLGGIREILSIRPDPEAPAAEREGGAACGS